MDIQQYEQVFERMGELVRKLDDMHRWIMDATELIKKADAEGRPFVGAILEEGIKSTKAGATVIFGELKGLSEKMIDCWEVMEIPAVREERLKILTEAAKRPLRVLEK
jgi:hypothetical protein